MMMMMSRFCIVCFFLIILPAYVILGSLNTVSTMVELCNNRSINTSILQYFIEVLLIYEAVVTRCEGCLGGNNGHPHPEPEYW